MGIMKPQYGPMKTLRGSMGFSETPRRSSINFKISNEISKWSKELLFETS